VLGSITDQKIAPTRPPPREQDQRTNSDYGFQTALFRPDQYSKGANPDPLPPAGPARARATLLALRKSRVGKHGDVVLRLACPSRSLTKSVDACRGTARVQGSRVKRRYSLAAGRQTISRFTLKPAALRRLIAAGSAALEAVATNADAAGGTTSKVSFTV